MMKKWLNSFKKVVITGVTGGALAACSLTPNTVKAPLSYSQMELPKASLDLLPDYARALEEQNGFELKASSVMKGYHYNFDQVSQGRKYNKPLFAYNFPKGKNVYFHFSANKPFAVLVYKFSFSTGKWVVSGWRYPKNGWKFYESGFKDPDFGAVYMVPYTFFDDTHITSAMMVVNDVVPSDSLNNDQLVSHFGEAGTGNQQTYTLPFDLTYNNQKVSKLRVNRVAAPKMISFLSALNASGQFDKNRSYCGIYRSMDDPYKRYLDGSYIEPKQYSIHAFGAAIDLFGCNHTSVPSEAVEIARKHDMIWGGSPGFGWDDPIHFELTNPHFDR